MFQSKTTVGFSTALVSALMALLLLAVPASADTPAPGYERFAGCPSPKENPAVNGCMRSVINSGQVKMGSKTVPITNPITLVGGTTTEGTMVANSKGGLTPVKQQVPGGIIGMTGWDWLINFLDIDSLKLYAITELAGHPKLGDNLSLPVKVRLVNPILGNNCYIGSVSNPLALDLTTGTTSPPPPNKPISGHEPENVFIDELHVFHLEDAKFVDNAFAVPGASGCVLNLLGFIPVSLNGLVNSQSGLPSPAGTNEMVQNADLELVEPRFVYP